MRKLAERDRCYRQLQQNLAKELAAHAPTREHLKTAELNVREAFLWWQDLKQRESNKAARIDMEKRKMGRRLQCLAAIAAARSAMKIKTLLRLKRIGSGGQSHDYQERTSEPLSSPETVTTNRLPEPPDIAALTSPTESPTTPS